MPYYPVFLSLQGKRCVVVGGGAVAERKVMSLLECGGAVLVISPRVVKGLRLLAEQGKLRLLERSYRHGDLKGAKLAIAATNNADVNAAVAGEAQKRGILVNVVDDPVQSDFIVPSSLRRGELVIAVSTSGESPALARKIRTELEKRFDPEYAQLVALVSEVRREQQRKGKKPKSSIWQKSLNPDILLDMLKKGDFAQAKKKLTLALGQHGRPSK